MRSMVVGILVPNGPLAHASTHPLHRRFGRSPSPAPLRYAGEDERGERPRAPTAGVGCVNKACSGS